MSRRDIRRLALQALYQIDLSVPVQREAPKPETQAPPASEAQAPPASEAQAPPASEAEAPPALEAEAPAEPEAEKTETAEAVPANEPAPAEIKPAAFNPDYPSLQREIAKALFEAHQSQDVHDPEMPVLDQIQALANLDEQESLDHLKIWCDKAAEIACLVWQMRETIDPILTDLADEWPLHRQPPLDRSIMRLCGFEMLTEFAPMPVPIHEAVELAKEFCQENSANFVNGVLDGLARKLKEDNLLASRKEALPGHLKETARTNPVNSSPKEDETAQEDWLSDALDAS